MHNFSDHSQTGLAVQSVFPISEIDGIILEIFNRQPLADQPRFLLDVGCGNGTLLAHLYQCIVQQTERGKLLGQYPLTLIGVENDDRALAACATVS